VWTTPDQLRVAYIGGCFDAMQYESPKSNPFAPQYVKDELDQLVLTADQAVDILLTHDTPMFMAPEPLPCESPVFHEVIQLLCPRYTFSAGPVSFFERAPYSNLDRAGQVTYPTRFLTLGTLSDPKKSKWFYAFNIIPRVKNPQISQGADDTPNPFTADMDLLNSVGPPEGLKRSRVDSLPSTSIPVGPMYQTTDWEPPAKKPRAEYVCKICNIPGHFIQACPEKQERRRPEENPMPECWFCLSSPSLSKHLLFTVGDTVYGAVAKGALTPLHCILSPIEHLASIHAAPRYEQPEWKGLRGKVHHEIHVLQQRLHQIYASKGQVPVIFELARSPGARGMHAHVQIIPVPADRAGDVATALESAFSNRGFAFTVLDLPKGAGLEDTSKVLQAAKHAHRDRCDPGYPHFTLAVGKSLYFFAIPKGVKFPPQLGREVIGEAIGEQARAADWKSCVDEQTETAYAAELRSALGQSETATTSESSAPAQAEIEIESVHADSAQAE
jgi:diadenosine tetraphosphate (Ap4A) HIT family hydrolase